MLEFNNAKLNTIIGLIFVVVILVFFMLIHKSDKGAEELSKNSYKVYVSNIEGIKKNQLVGIGGFPVGFVQSIGISQNSPYLILSVDKNILLSADSQVHISSASLFASGKIINIVNGIDDNFLQNGDYIPDSTLGVSLDGLLNMIGIYLKQR
ncbi:MAG: MlaD family protein [Alphaproteobacteria bacterium]|jgi:ABC-type transporter Mla subunit MlaD|nr:MlaD family protein [Alphaproteobacteria bacterium]